MLPEMIDLDTRGGYTIFSLHLFPLGPTLILKNVLEGLVCLDSIDSRIHFAK